MNEEAYTIFGAPVTDNFAKGVIMFGVCMATLLALALFQDTWVEFADTYIY
jgi:hypothetical protein